MSIIQKIRDKAAVLLTTAIALSLIGFLVQDAFIGKTGNSFASPSTTVGSINGKDIDAVEFSSKVNMAEQNYRQQGMQTNEMVTQNIVESIWNGYVQEELVRGEADKLGLSLTAKELGNLLFSDDAPQEFKQLFTNQNTGMYDIQAARTWFNNLKKSKKSEDLKMVNDQLINPLHIRLLTDKYNSLFTNGVYVPTWMVEKLNADNTGFASISFTGAPYGTISDSLASLKISDKEIADYIDKHKEDFKQEKTRSISYVVFDANPTGADTASVINQLNGLKEEFLSTTDAKAFVTRNNTTLPYYDGYSLGSKLQMGAKQSIIDMPAGTVVGPYADAGSFVLAKKIAVRTVPDSVKCRHILIGTVDPQTGAQIRPDSTAKRTADSVIAAVRSGANFGALAAQLSDDQGSKNNAGEYNFSTADVNLAREFYDFIFYGKTGDREVVKTSFGYHILEVLSQKNFEEAYKVAYLAKKVIASEETDNAAQSAAIQFAGNSRSPKAFDETANKQNLPKLIADNIREMDYSVAGMPSRPFVKWIYENKVGTISEPFDLKDKYVVAMITGTHEEGVQSASTARIMVEPVLRNKKKAAEIIRKIGTASTLEAIATAIGGQVNQVDTLRFSDPFVANLGSEPKVIGAAFNKDNLSKLSKPIEGQNGVFVIRTNQVGALAGMGVDVKLQRKSLEAQLKQFASYSTLESLRKSADIEDERRKAGY